MLKSEIRKSSRCFLFRMHFQRYVGGNGNIFSHRGKGLFRTKHVVYFCPENINLYATSFGNSFNSCSRKGFYKKQPKIKTIWFAKKVETLQFRARCLVHSRPHRYLIPAHEKHIYPGLDSYKWPVYVCYPPRSSHVLNPQACIDTGSSGNLHNSRLRIQRRR